MSDTDEPSVHMCRDCIEEARAIFDSHSKKNVELNFLAAWSRWFDCAPIGSIALMLPATQPPALTYFCPRHAEIELATLRKRAAKLRDDADAVQRAIESQTDA